MLRRLECFLLLIAGLSSGCVGYEIRPDRLPSANATPPIRTTDEIGMSDKIVENDLFSLVIPRSLEKRVVEGEDSNLSEFSNEDVSISLEYGPMVQTLEGGLLRRYSEYREEWKLIGSERAKIISFNYGEQSTVLSDPSKKFVIAAHFPRSSKDKTPLTLWISFRSDNQREDIMRIIASVKFK